MGNLKGNRHRGRKRVLIALTLAGIVCIATGMTVLLMEHGLLATPRSDNSLGVVDGSLLEEIPYGELTQGAFYITADRRSYAGDMHLVIPSIAVDTLVGTSTEPAGLKNRPGLYEFSQMPHEVGGNVSIAAHRDIHNMEFYHLDRLQEGDALYLIYQGLVYRYRYEQTLVVSAGDWSVILPREHSMLTLTTCEPIGTTRSRLVVTGLLEEIGPCPEDNTYAYGI